jgi:uncharacterized protein (DUF885 family)
MTTSADGFAGRVEAFLAETFALDPIRATDAGMHGHDTEWPDWSDEGRRARIAFADRWLTELRAFPDGELTADQRIDRDQLVGELEALRFSETDLRQDAWDALAWVEGIGTGLFLILAREYAPPPVRMAALTGRLAALPRVVDAAIDALVGLPGIPVSRLHAETAVDQLPGVSELVAEAVSWAEDAATADGDVAHLLPDLRAAADQARDAVGRLEAHVRDVVLPSSEGEGRLGAERFEHQLRHTLRDPEVDAERLLGRAEREARAVRAEMRRIAIELWPARLPGRPLPADEGQIIRGVLDAIAAEHPAADDLLDACRTRLAEIEAFCRQKGLIGLAAEPLTIDWAPAFLRGFGGASLWSPGPLDRSLPALFLITPVPDEWSADERESWLRELNDRQISLLTIHEAVPGHYLQGVRANEEPSIVRTVFGSGVFAEGWAVYVTQVMIDAGFDSDDLALRLVHWKFYLRAILNAILDIRVHAHGMTEEDAIALLVDGGFQEPSEARNKFKRARLTSAQLSTYFVGGTALQDLEVEVRRRAAARVGIAWERAGDGDLPGGHGDSPGFARRQHLEAVIAHGTPPIPLLRRILLDDEES